MSSRVNVRAALLIGAGWSVLAAFDVWLLLIRPSADWHTKIAFVLGLIGVYTFAFGVLSATDLLKRLPIGPDLTSPNPLKFIAGNATALGILQMALALAVTPERTRESLDRRGGLLIGLVQGPLVIVGCLLAVAFTLVYVVLIAPLAWVAYVIVSVALDSAVNSGKEFALAMTDPSTGEQSTVKIKELITEHQVTLRNLLVAVPSLVSSLILGAPSLV